MTLTDSGAPARTATNTRVHQSVQKLREQRDEALRELALLTEAECRYPAKWNNIDRTVNFLLRAFALHEIDHLQHMQRLLRARGRQAGEAELLLSKAQALRGELEALVLGLSDEEFEASGPGEGWSIRQLVEHLAVTDQRYLESVRQALAAKQAAGDAATPA